MIRITARCFGLLLISALPACVNLQKPLPPAPTVSLPELQSVPFFAQRTRQCGPAALATVMQWAGAEVTPDQLTSAVMIAKRQGSLQIELVAATRQHGLLPYTHEGGLATLWQLLEQQVPVLVLQNLAFSWYPRWHYAVVVGFDAARSEVLLRSGTERLGRESLTDFVTSWHYSGQWMLTVHQPDSVPPNANPLVFLQAAAALAETGQGDAAAKAYAAATQAWPEQMLAWMALGNHYYQHQAFRQAAHAYEHAVKIAPDHPAPVHNLAWSMIKLQQQAAAQPLALRAVELSRALPLAQQAQYLSAAQALKLAP